MKNILNKKILLIVIALSALIFFAVTSLNEGGEAFKQKDLNENKEKVKSLVKQVKEIEAKKLLVDQNQVAKICNPIINKTKEDLPFFKNENHLKETMISYRILYECYSMAGDNDNAATSVVKIMEMEPQVPKWHGEIAKTYMKAKKYGLAKRHAHLASQLEPLNYEWYEMEGDIVAKFGNYVAAVTAYKKALEYAPLEAAAGLAKKIENNTIETVDDEVEVISEDGEVDDSVEE